MEQERPDRVNFRYVEGRDYRLVPVSGVSGGITPDGQVIAHLFREFAELPETATHEVGPDGRLGNEIAQTWRHAEGIWIERRLVIGTVLSGDTARCIGKWFIDRAEDLERLKEGRKGEA